MSILYYKSCKELPIYNFYKIVDDEDLRYLVKNYSEDDNNIKVDKRAKSIFQKILEEYSELTSNKEIITNIKMRMFILELEFDKDNMQNILQLFKDTNDFSVLSLLSSFGFNIKESDDIDASLKRVISKIKGLKNKIRINKIKYEKRFEKSKEKIKTNLDKEALILEMNLQLGREIDIRKTTVFKWITMIKISKEKSEEIQKSLNR